MPQIYRHSPPDLHCCCTSLNCCIEGRALWHCVNNTVGICHVSAEISPIDSLIQNSQGIFVPLSPNPSHLPNSPPKSSFPPNIRLVHSRLRGIFRHLFALCAWLPRRTLAWGRLGRGPMTNWWLRYVVRYVWYLDTLPLTPHDVNILLTMSV